MCNAAKGVAQRVRYLNIKFNNAAEVADYLKSKGIKGKADTASSCPIANYLSKSISCDDHYVEVQTDEIWLMDRGNNRSPKDYFIGPASSEFVINFDSGDYPDLNVYA